MNKKNSTKQRPFVSRLRISSVCRVVLMLAVVKAGFLVYLTINTEVPQTAELTPEPVTRPSLSSAAETTVYLFAPQSEFPEQTGAPGAVPASADRPASEPAPAETPVARTPARNPGEPLDLSPDEHAIAASFPSLFSASIAQAADTLPMPAIVPPAPAIRPMASPTAPAALGAPDASTAAPADPAASARPDDATPATPPAPQVGTYVSRDSAAQKEAEINRREQELMALQQQMDSRMGELRGLENRLQGMLYDANSTQDGKMRQLIDMYANMKPRVAAQALTTMDEDIAVKILTGMKSKGAGEIMSYMDPTHAARLSELVSKMQML